MANFWGIAFSRERWVSTGIILLLGILLLLLQYQLWFAKGGIKDMGQAKQTIAQQSRENDQLKQRNLRLSHEVSELKQGQGAAQERARHDMGMVKKGETFYQLINPEGGAV